MECTMFPEISHVLQTHIVLPGGFLESHTFYWHYNMRPEMSHTTCVLKCYWPNFNAMYVSWNITHVISPY